MILKGKLSRIQSPIRRLAIGTLVKFLLSVGRFSGNRARVHWVGYKKRRRRPERFLCALLFLFGIALLEPFEFAYWSVLAGGVTAIYVDLYVIYLLIPRKSAHWL